MSEESSPSRLRAKLMGARGEAVLQRAPDLQRHLNNTGVSSDTLLAGGNAALANLLTMDGCPTVNLGASQEEWEKELLEVGNFCRELMPVAKYLNAFSTCQSISQRTDDAALDDFKAAVARFMEDTPFHVAQQNGDGRLLVSYTYSLPIAKHLLEAEGVKEALAAAPNTLAWLAQTGVNSDIIKACIEAGAALTNETVQSESALSAVFNNYTDPDFLKFVLSKAQPEHINFARPSYGWTVLETMIRNVQADRAIMLAEAGADLFASGVYGSTAFSAVATCYDADLLTRLLAVEAIKAQLQPKAGYLFAQVTSNWNSSPSDALFDALKAAGASVNETSAGCEGFRPAIQTFVSNGYTALVRKMVDAGCDIKASIFDGASLLFSASTEEMVDLLLELGVDPRATNTNGYTAAMQAVMNYWTAAALKLIPKTDLTAVNFIGQNILHVAASYNNVDVMRAVLATDGASALVNVKDQNGSTPLVVAISSTGNADLVNLLLEQGADPDIIANDGTSALLASTTYAAIFSSLLPKAKATLEAKDGSGRTALWRAANSSSVEAIQAALEAGADITVVDNDNANVLFAYVSGSVPLDIALLTRLLDGVTNASLARTSDIATAAVNLIPNRYSQEAFAAAFRLFAERGLLSHKTADSTSNAVGHLFRNVNYNESVIAPLIQELVAQAQAAGDLDATLTQVIGGDTVLHYAAYRGSEPENDAFNTQLKVFLDAAPHLINARRETDGRTPLIVAAAGNNPGAVQILLERGADWTAKDNNGVTALDASTTSRCVTALIQKGAKINFDTFNATLLNDDSFVEALKDQLADLKPNAAILLAAVDTSGDCFLRRMVDKALAEKTLNVNGEVNGQTAVHRIAYAGNNVGDAQYDWMKLLIDAGADVNLVRTDGATPLLEALRGSNRGALELLLAHGSIEVNKLSQGETLLTYAVRNSKAQDIIESLLAKGADKNMANGEGKLAHELTDDATIKALVQV